MLKPISYLIGAVIVLNFLGWIIGDWNPTWIIYSTGFSLSCIPVIRYFTLKPEGLPFFPFISLIYGVYYFLFGLIPFEPYYTMQNVSKDGLFWASLYSLVGLISLQLGYSLTELKVKERSAMKFDLDSEAATRLLILGLIGVVGWIFSFLKLVPLSAQTLITLTSELLMFAFSALFYLQLKGRIPKRFVLINWFFLFPVILFTTLATSLLYPLLRMILLAFLIYAFVNKQLPWRKVFLVGALLLPAFFLKISFRQIESASNTEKFSNVSQMFEKVKLYGDAGNMLIDGMDSQLVSASLNSVASRFDLTYMFGFIVDFSPNQIPYLYGKSYQSLLWKPIPRAIFPSKPKENWGNELGHKFGWLGEDDDDTSVNLPQMIEFYLNFGLPGVMFGMMAIGSIYAFLIRLLYSGGHPVEGLVALFLLSTLFNVESNFSLVFGGLPYTLIILGFILKKALRPFVRPVRCLHH